MPQVASRTCAATTPIPEPHADKAAAQSAQDALFKLPPKAFATNHKDRKDTQPCAAAFTDRRLQPPKPPTPKLRAYIQLVGKNIPKA